MTSVRTRSQNLSSGDDLYVVLGGTPAEIATLNYISEERTEVSFTVDPDLVYRIPYDSIVYVEESGGGR